MEPSDRKVASTIARVTNCMPGLAACIALRSFQSTRRLAGEYCRSIMLIEHNGCKHARGVCPRCYRGPRRERTKCHSKRHGVRCILEEARAGEPSMAGGGHSLGPHFTTAQSVPSNLALFARARGASVTRWAAINAIQWRAVAVLVFCVLVPTGCKKWTQRGAKRVGWLPKSLRERRSRAIKSSDRHASVAPTREHRSTLAAQQPSPAAPPPVNHQRGAAECSV